jgi:hypothetical protein
VPHEVPVQHPRPTPVQRCPTGGVALSPCNPSTVGRGGPLDGPPPDPTGFRGHQSMTDEVKYDETGRCIASPYRRGLRALGTSPRALGVNPRAKARNKWAQRKWRRHKRDRTKRRTSMLSIRRVRSIRLRAERKAGQLLAKTIKRGGDQKSNSRAASSILKDNGISHNQSAQWQKLGAMPAGRVAATSK